VGGRKEKGSKAGVGSEWEFNKGLQEDDDKRALDGFEPRSDDPKDHESLGMRVRVMSYVGSISEGFKGEERYCWCNPNVV
jgi:hypothetical protein